MPKRLVLIDDLPAMPRTRGECGVERPCPFVRCRHHMFLEINLETGAVKLNFPGLELWDLDETCSLDVADRGEVTLEEVGGLLGRTRERIRQLEVRGLMQLRALGVVLNEDD